MARQHSQGWRSQAVAVRQRECDGHARIHAHMISQEEKRVQPAAGAWGMLSGFAAPREFRAA